MIKAPSRQSRLRERRKADGGVRVDVMLSKAGFDAMTSLRHGTWMGKTDSDLIEAAITKCAVDSGVFKLPALPNPQQERLQNE